MEETNSSSSITVVVPCSHHASKFSPTPTWTITTILSIIISWSCQVIFKTDYITITPSPSSEWSTTKKWDWCWYYFHTHDFLLLTNATPVILFKIWLIYWTHLLLLLFNSCLHLYLLDKIFSPKNITVYILSYIPTDFIYKKRICRQKTGHGGWSILTKT